MSSPLYVWTDSHGTGRNVFAIFRRTFQLSAVPKSAVLHLFADTRYRLRVNGAVASYGPARFAPRAPEFDSVELAPFLKKGRNVVTVEANSKGASSFESLPSIGGFIAWGAIASGTSAKNKIDFTTPGAWQARRADAWLSEAPPFSFAQGPTEIVDLRKLPQDWFTGADGDAGWSTPVAIEKQDNWGALRPRSIPLLTRDIRTPEKILLAAELDASEMRVGFMVDNARPPLGGNRVRVCYATHVYAPNAQTATLGAFWGPHYLNGEALKAERAPGQGNRENFSLQLKQGWNFLYGEPEILEEGWGVLLGLPAGRGLVFAATPDANSAETILHSGAIAREELEPRRKAPPSSAAELFELPGGGAWRRVARGERLPLPAREAGWDRAGAALPLAPFAVTDVRIPAGKDATIVFDFGGEYIGHALLDVDAPEGTVFDVVNDERLRSDGMLNIFETNWAINSADRFVARGGAEQLEGFHPRGGRYLQVTVRGALGPVTLSRVAIRHTAYPLHVDGAFASSDPLFNWIYQTGIPTLQACMEDSYTDCPWRERGCYLGDALAELHATRAVTSDLALMRRCLWLWAKAQRDNGQMQDVAPSYHWTALPDYTLIWVIALRDFWSVTGDKALAAELWPSMQPLFASSLWKEEPSGLWNADALSVFCDWGATAETKKGESGPLNAYRYQALNCAAELATVLGKTKEAATFKKEALRVRKAFQSLWDAKHGRFAATRTNGALVMEGAIHSNILALLFGLSTPAQYASALEFIIAETETNHALKPGHSETYFFYYLLNLLYSAGKVREAERAIRNNYGLMRAGGAWTLWEVFSGHGSLCHAWSGAPLQSFIERTLGVRPAKPGQPDAIVIAPQFADVAWVRGSAPHRKGPIHVAWRVDAGRLELDVSLPKGVKATVIPPKEFAKGAVVKVATRKS